jgi:hypothetical protein
LQTAIQPTKTATNIIETIDDIFETSQKGKDLIDSFNRTNQNDFQTMFSKLV